MSTLAEQAQRTRMVGTSAVDLVLVADGGFDASVTLSNRSWDVAAGVVIAREAGALVTDIDGTAHTAASRTTVAAARGVHAELIAAVRTPATGTRYDPPTLRPLPAAAASSAWRGPGGGRRGLSRSRTTARRTAGRLSSGRR